MALICRCGFEENKLVSRGSSFFLLQIYDNLLPNASKCPFFLLKTLLSDCNSGHKTKARATNLLLINELSLYLNRLEKQTQDNLL